MEGYVEGSRGISNHNNIDALSIFFLLLSKIYLNWSTFTPNSGSFVNSGAATCIHTVSLGIL